MSLDIHADKLLILDFGSQYTQLIARRVREERVYCEIQPPDRKLSWIRDWGPSGVILSGGPASVYDDEGPGVAPELLDGQVPVLGICYGMQLIAHVEGGDVVHGRREYGRAGLVISRPSALFEGFETGESTTV